MTNEQILELIGAKPGIRTVEMSDKLDCDIEQLQDMLIDLFRRGLIVARDIIGPNKRPAKAYWLKGVAHVEASAPTPADVPSIDAAVPSKTKVDQAIEFIAARGKSGSATSAELHSLLKLKPHEYASSYLNSPIKDGRLVKDGKTWTLGNGIPPAPVAETVKGPFDKPEQQSQELDTPSCSLPIVDVALLEAHTHWSKPTQDRTSTPIDTSAAPSPAPVSPAALVSAPAHVPEFSCALWSHGELHLVRAGNDLAKLSAAETKQLCEYLDRLGESVEVTT